MVMSAPSVDVTRGNLANPVSVAWPNVERVRNPVKTMEARAMV
jgi:hypothetical protein